MPTYTAADIGKSIDVIINGVGYAFYDADGGKKFGFTDVKAAYSYSPTFVTKQTVNGDFGDNQQDFWLTFTQRDWSLGEGLRYMRLNDGSAIRRYWQGDSVDVNRAGEAKLQRATSTLTTAALPTAICGGDSTIFFTTSANLYSIDTVGTITNLGAHGLGTSPTVMTYDPSGDLYFAGAATGIRKWDGAAFTTFSATTDTYKSLEYNSNTLYAITTSILYSFDTAGVRTEAFPWKGSDGVAFADANSRIVGFGGRIAILRGAVATGAELWLYDGTGVFLVAKFPKGFKGDGLVVLNGTIFVGGVTAPPGAVTAVRPTIYYYANGSIDKLWESYEMTVANTEMPLALWNNGIVFLDNSRTNFPLTFYNPVTGGTSKLFVTTTAFTAALATTKSILAVGKMDSGTSIYFYPETSTYTSPGFVTSSLVDFESSLTKLFRGIKVDFEPGVFGDHGSVDIAYQIDGVTEAGYTTLQTGAVAGTEYTLSGITGKAISVKITLKKGTSGTGPTLRRVSVRAAPKQPPFRRATYIVNCTGVNGTNPVLLRDGSFSASDGLSQATNLTSVVNTATPVTIIDELGSYTGVIEGDSFELRRIGPEEFVAHVQCREV